MNSENKLTLALVGNKTQLIIWWIVTAACALFFIGGIGASFSSEDSVAALIVFAIVFFALGVLCYVVKIRKLKAKKAALLTFREYIARLSNDEQKSTAKLAASMGRPLVLVESQIETLISMGLIKNAYIDKSAHILVLSQYGLYDQRPDLVPVKCSCCSGTTPIPQNTVGECMYCGSPISAGTAG